MISKLFNFMLVVGAIQGFLFVTVPFFLKKKIARPIWFLNGTVFFISLNNLQAWIIGKGYFSTIYFIKYFEVPWHMLIVPFFYSFLIYYLRLDRKFKPFVHLTLLIFSIEILIMSILILSIYKGSIEIRVLERYIQGIEIINASYTVFIFIKALHIIFKPNNNYNYMLSYDNMKWLKQFLIFGVFVIMLWIVGIVLNLYIDVNEQRFTYYPMRLGSSILIYWIGYQGLIRFNLTEERISLRRELEKGKAEKLLVQENIKEEKTGESDEVLKKVFKTIEEHILQNQLFTNSLLSLNSIAEELNISKNVLSKSINHCSGKNFSDYINKFRVAFAKEMLVDKKYEKHTITSIGLECGFNSKSTFYASFKKFTNKTPLTYRKENKVI